MKKISIVAPVYNEEDNIEHFYEELCKAVVNLEYEFEFIFIDDGSKDKSAFILEALTKKDDRVRPLYLSRNYGH
mgnify:FL=1